MDTGGLGLLQLLIQAGVPPQALLALLSHQNTLGQPELNSGGGGPGGPVGGTGAVSSGEGTPGVGPTDGTATGTGNMTVGQTIDAGISGIPGGAIGQIGGPAVGLGAKAGMTIGSLLGGHLGPIGLMNSLLGPVVGIARGAQGSLGTRGPQTLPEALKEFTQDLKDMTLRSFFFGKEPDLTPPKLPDLPFYDPFAPKNTEDEPDPNAPVPDDDPTVPSMTADAQGPAPNAPTAPSESGIGPGAGGNPGGGEGDD